MQNMDPSGNDRPDQTIHAGGSQDWSERGSSLSIPMRKQCVCGKMMPVDCRFCMHCGNRIDGLPPAPRPELKPVAKPPSPALRLRQDLKQENADASRWWTLSADGNKVHHKLCPEDDNARSSVMSNNLGLYRHFAVGSTFLCSEKKVRQWILLLGSAHNIIIRVATADKRQGYDPETGCRRLIFKCNCGIKDHAKKRKRSKTSKTRYRGNKYCACRFAITVDRGVEGTRCKEQSRPPKYVVVSSYLAHTGGCTSWRNVAERWPIFYDRLSSNNAARVRFWLYLREQSDRVQSVQVRHVDQLTPWFREVNPLGKVPALSVCKNRPLLGPALLAEAAVILEYLEDNWLISGRGSDGASSSQALPSLIPGAPLSRAHMRFVIRTHDMYLCSPNTSQRGPFSHTQGCMYLPPPPSSSLQPSERPVRWIDRPTRAAKLRECWTQLDNLEGLIRGDYFVGPALSLADLTVFPTMCYFCFYTSVVFSWRRGAVFHRRPKLRAWCERMITKIPAARRVRDELLKCMQEKERSGALAAIIEETKDSRYKWVYP